MGPKWSPFDPMEWMSPKLIVSPEDCPVRWEMRGDDRIALDLGSLLPGSLPVHCGDQEILKGVEVGTFLSELDACSELVACFNDPTEGLVIEGRIG
jgi:hypothetical protein